MDAACSSVAQQIAAAAIAFERRRTGHTPQRVSVVLTETTLVITLHNALSPAEIVLAQTPAGAAQLQEFHRELFDTSAEAFRREIQRITGVAVHEAVAEIEPETGTVIHAFTSGDVVQVFLLAGIVPAGTWTGSHPRDSA